MVNKLPELSIFFPFWNEEKNIEKVVKKAISVVADLALKWEIIIVDDYSTDKTLEIAQKLAKENSQIKIIHHTSNRGYGAALKSGFKNAKYNLVIFTDGDNQFDFRESSRLLAKIDKADLVIGFRKKRYDNKLRHLLMNLLKIWDFVFFGFYFRDIDCGFKLFKKSALSKIGVLNSEGAMITTEILAKAKRNNLRIEQVEVTHYPRIYGDQSGGNLRVVSRAVWESFLLWLDLVFQYGRN